MNRGLTCAVLTACLWFGAPAAAAEPPGACAYLAKAVDAQPGGPVFLPSYPTVASGALHQAAYLYDNAVATVALVGCGQRAKAARIGEAMLAALDRDRYWHDGRMRNAYLAGPVRSGAIKLPGYWDPQQNKWLEDAYQVGSDSGNMAWAVLALLALDQPGGDRRYRDAAIRIGNWVARWRSSRGAGGFTGGVLDEEPNPRIANWKSSEHNSDLAAAFSRLAAITGDKGWTRQAQVAEKYVLAMWNPSCRCFDSGTVEDGTTHNRYLALDSQLLPLLALPGGTARHGAALATVNTKMRVDGGYGFGEARGGIWTEGTLQAALVMELLGRGSAAQDLIKAAETLRQPDGSYLATNAKQLATGLTLDMDQSQSRQYFRIAHLAPVAWAALVERRFNPFTRQSGLP